MPTFTSDYVSGRAAMWERLLAPLRDQPSAILEVGSYEGRSALFFLGFLPQARLTCVDLFLAPYEPLFDQNLGPHLSRVEKLKGASATLLGPLLEGGRRFDVIYIDGSHARDDVLIDSALAWQMLVPGGILIWDDYRWQPEAADAARPQSAIDAFLRLHRREVAVVLRGYQVAIRRKRAAEMRPELNLRAIGRWLRGGKRLRRLDWRGDGRDDLGTAQPPRS